MNYEIGDLFLVKRHRRVGRQVWQLTDIVHHDEYLFRKFMDSSSQIIKIYKDYELQRLIEEGVITKLQKKSSRFRSLDADWIEL